VTCRLPACIHVHVIQRANFLTPLRARVRAYVKRDRPKKILKVPNSTTDMNRRLPARVHARLTLSSYRARFAKQSAAKYCSVQAVGFFGLLPFLPPKPLIQSCIRGCSRCRRRHRSDSEKSLNAGFRDDIHVRSFAQLPMAMMMIMMMMKIIMMTTKTTMLTMTPVTTIYARSWRLVPCVACVSACVVVCSCATTLARCGTFGVLLPEWVSRFNMCGLSFQGSDSVLYSSGASSRGSSRSTTRASSADTSDSDASATGQGRTRAREP
jgi:hypothetical protein